MWCENRDLGKDFLVWFFLFDKNRVMLSAILILLFFS